MPKDLDLETLRSIAGQVINLLQKQRYRNSDAVSSRTADAGLTKLNQEVKNAYGAPPPSWNDFIMRANTFLDLAERHRGQSEWNRRLDDIFSQLEASREQIGALELQRQQERQALEERARGLGLQFTSRS